MPIPSQPVVGSLLWRSLRVYQVYGANTEVGKTVFSTVLCKAARRHWPLEKTAFLKPVSTGPLDEADDRCKRDAFLTSSTILTCVTDVSNLNLGTPRF